MESKTFDAIAIRLGAGASRRKVITMGAGAALLAAFGRVRTVAASHCPYGNLTCKNGFVWREAVYADYVCVDPSQRDQAAADNAAAASRIDPNGAYGPHSCISGYVWREAAMASGDIGENDLVCVEPWVRDQVWYDNQPDVQLSRMEPGCNHPLVPPA